MARSTSVGYFYFFSLHLLPPFSWKKKKNNNHDKPSPQSWSSFCLTVCLRARGQSRTAVTVRRLQSVTSRDDFYWRPDERSHSVDSRCFTVAKSEWLALTATPTQFKLLSRLHLRLLPGANKVSLILATGTDTKREACGVTINFKGRKRPTETRHPGRRL